MRRFSVVVFAVLALAGSAGAGGGTLRAFVLLPARGQLAVVDVGRGVVGTLAVPRGAGPVATSIDGSRVLVANTRFGVVTELNGITGRRVHTFRSLGRPVDIALLPRATFGLVRSRYALVADARGRVDVLDLDAGRIIRRLAVPAASSLAVVGSYVWVASAGRASLTQLDLNAPRQARVVARVRLGFVPAAFAPDPRGAALAVVARDRKLVRVDAVSLAQSRLGQLGGKVTQLLAGYQGVLWAGETDGRVLGVRARDGKLLQVMHVPVGSRLKVVFGWLAALHGHELRVLPLGTPARGTATPLPAAAGGFAFASIS
jgi:DNA-binding beta-propeller fold protein YncE